MKDCFTGVKDFRDCYLSRLQVDSSFGFPIHGLAPDSILVAYDIARATRSSHISRTGFGLVYLKPNRGSTQGSRSITS